MLSEYNYTITDKQGKDTWTATEYKILNEGSGGGTFARDNSQAGISYICEYNEVERFLDTIIGKTVKGTDSLVRSAASPDFDPANGSLPEPHPIWNNLFAASAEVVPLGVPANTTADTPFWNKARINVVFRPIDYNIISDDDYDQDTEVDRFVTKIPEGSAEFQTSQGIFRFVTDPKHRPLEIQPGFVIAAQRFTYIWRQIPVVFRDDGYPDLGKIPNIDTIGPMQGQINSVEFDGFAPGTVVFSSYSPKLILPQLASPNSYYWDISYSLGIRDYGTSSTPIVSDEHLGWNYAWDPTREVWDLYTDDGTDLGKTMYKYGDLNILFQVTW